MNIELTQREIDQIYFRIKNYVKNQCNIDLLQEMTDIDKSEFETELKIINKFSKL